MLAVFTLIYLSSVGIQSSEASHCFECSNKPHLRDCSIVRQCNTHEVCYVEQILTTSGHVTFNSGCRDIKNCHKLLGRNVGSSYDDHGNKTGTDDHTHTLVRRTDVSVCEQCCYTDYCNKEGCGETVTPASQRGPYCFNCDRQDGVESCRHVTQCSTTQVCAINKLIDTGHVVYDSHCIEQAQCDAIKQSYHNVFGRRSQNTTTTRNLAREHVTTELNQNSRYLEHRLDRGNTLVSLCLLCCESDFCNDNCIKNVREIPDDSIL